jgi:WD40 repeat protein
MTIQEASVVEMALSSSSRLAAILRTDGRVGLFDAGSGQVRCAFQAHNGLIQIGTFSGDENILATGGRDGRVRLWDVHRCRLLFDLEGVPTTIWRLAFSPDSKLLVSTARDGSTRVWDLDSQTLIDVIPTTEPTTDVTFIGDGSWIATVGQTGHLRLWKTVIENQGAAKVAELARCVTPFTLSSEHLVLNTSHKFRTCL